MDKNASPVLKWAGGKKQLLPQIRRHYPSVLKEGGLDVFIEPFVGGGAVYFDIAGQFSFKKAYLIDTNHELVILYQSLKSAPQKIIQTLARLEERYLSLDENGRKNMFYEMREEYNDTLENTLKKIQSSHLIPERAALTIFLNRTCFNGLFRVNRKGFFNVPQGRYKNPKILFPDKIMHTSTLLKKATILQGDFSDAARYVCGKTFIYYDPPYRPVSPTAHFTAYAKDSFDDNDQIRLADFYKSMDQKGAIQLLSNSDTGQDGFFDHLYQDFNIKRVDARRNINSKANARGPINELLIRNYGASEQTDNASASISNTKNDLEPT